MADVNEWTREREKRESREKDVNHPFRLPLVLSFHVCAAALEERCVQNNMLLWSGLEMTVELNAGWETANSVRYLWRRLLCAWTPPSHPFLHNTQRLRLTRTYQVISGQADLSLSLPRAFLFETLFSYFLFPLSLSFMSFSVSHSCLSISLPSSQPLFFIVYLLSTLRGLGG